MTTSIKTRYLRLVRRAYRLLRSPTFKRHPRIQRMMLPLFERERWQPCRQTVANGLAIGLFVSQIPVPGQMLLAAILTLPFRANLPLSIAACWVTNPLTMGPIVFWQAKLGDFLRANLGIPVHPFLERLDLPLGIIPGLDGESINVGSWILGFVAAGLFLFLLTYPFIYLLSFLMPKLIPKTRYRRAKAKVIARQQKVEKSEAKAEKREAKKKGPVGSEP